VYHRGGRKAVEVGRGCAAVCTYVFAGKQVAAIQVGRQFFCHGNNIQAIAGRPEYRADWVGRFEGIKMILAVVKNDAGKRVVNAVINVIA